MRSGHNTQTKFYNNVMNKFYQKVENFKNNPSMKLGQSASRLVSYWIGLSSENKRIVAEALQKDLISRSNAAHDNDAPEDRQRPGGAEGEAPLENLAGLLDKGVNKWLTKHKDKYGDCTFALQPLNDTLSTPRDLKTVASLAQGFLQINDEDKVEEISKTFTKEGLGKTVLGQLLLRFVPWDQASNAVVPSSLLDFGKTDLVISTSAACCIFFVLFILFLWSGSEQK